MDPQFKDGFAQVVGGYSCALQKMNPNSGLTTYCLMQLLRQGENVFLHFRVGRIGDAGQGKEIRKPQKTLQEGKKAFREEFNRRTGDVWCEKSFIPAIGSQNSYNSFVFCARDPTFTTQQRQLQNYQEYNDDDDEEMGLPAHAPVKGAWGNAWANGGFEGQMGGGEDFAFEDEL